VIKKPRERGGYSPARGLQNTNPQWVVAPGGKKWAEWLIMFIYLFLNAEAKVITLCHFVTFR